MNKWIFLFSELTAIIAISGAIFLAYHERSGWGWCIFVAIMSQTSVQFAKPNEKGNP